MKNKLTETHFKSTFSVARYLITSQLFGAVLISLILMSGNAWAGPSALEGIVKDSTGRPVKGADVRIEAGKFSKAIKTDASGHYVSSGLAVGTYRVTVVVDGSLAASTRNATTKPGSYTQLNFNLPAKMAPVAKHTHSVWCPNETGTLIGGTGQWIDVDDNGNIVGNAGVNSNIGISSVEKVSGGNALQIRPSMPDPRKYGGQ